LLHAEEIIQSPKCICGPDSSVGIATDYWLDGPGLNPGGAKFFTHIQTGPGTHSLLYKGYLVFRGDKAAGAWC
jgi:hypothetical protein